MNAKPEVIFFETLEENSTDTFRGAATVTITRVDSRFRIVVDYCEITPDGEGNFFEEAHERFEDWTGTLAETRALYRRVILDGTKFRGWKRSVLKTWKRNAA